MDFKGVFILILPPSIEEMANRLRKRGTEPEESIQRRLKTGKQEIKSYQTYDYVITNNEVEETVESILAIVRAEKSRVSRYIPTSDDIKELLG
jgi:guanylate kinase